MTARCRLDKEPPAEADVMRALDIWDIAHDNNLPLTARVNRIAESLAELRERKSAPKLTTKWWEGECHDR